MRLGTPRLSLPPVQTDKIEDLRIITDGIDAIPIDYGFGVQLKTRIKISSLKRQLNHRFQINLPACAGSSVPKMS